MKQCHCGKPLHYTNKTLEERVQELVEKLGEFMPVEVFGKGTYAVQRHYIALHGIKGVEVDKLGFKKIK